MHLQTKFSQGKYVSVLKGAILDVAIDLRKNSKTYLKSIKIKLTAKNRHMSYIPRGFANGLQTLEDNTELVYFTTNFYNPKKEKGLSVLDPKLKIKLPLPIKFISKKDKSWELLT